MLAATGCVSSQPHRRSSRGGAAAPRAVAPATPVEEHAHRVLLLARSVRRHPIDAVELGDSDSRVRALVVGCIHGNEHAGIAIARSLITHAHVNEADLWVVADLNPDGVAADTRGNGHGVDLNRNFPHRQRVLGAPGTTYYPGPRPLSEPESVSIAALVHRLRPRITIYYHQHQAVVDDSQGPRWIERRYAADVGLPLRRLTDYPGSAAGWQDAQLGPTAFVVELPAGPLSRRQIDAHTDALLDVLPAA
jgi:protein MpaA